MELTYTYELVEADDSSRCATFLYKSDGLPDHLISVRYPFPNETFEMVIKSHAPIYQWSLLCKKFKKFPDNYQGSIHYKEETSPDVFQKKMIEGLIPCTII